MVSLDYQLRTFNDPILQQKCAPVEPGEPLPFVDAMRHVMRSRGGVGLAAPQIGVAKRVILVRNDLLINPVIIWASMNMHRDKEGCLSYPGIITYIERPLSVEVAYLNERHEPRKQQFTYFEARIVCHEIDHLSGVCLVGEAWRKERSHA